MFETLLSVNAKNSIRIEFDLVNELLYVLPRPSVILQLRVKAHSLIVIAKAQVHDLNAKTSRNAMLLGDVPHLLADIDIFDLDKPLEVLSGFSDDLIVDIMQVHATAGAYELLLLLGLDLIEQKHGLGHGDLGRNFCKKLKLKIIF